MAKHALLTPERRDFGDVQAAGVGPDGDALLVWSHYTAPDQLLITRHSSRDPSSAIPVQAAPRTIGPTSPDFVQPLPGGRTLLVHARSRTPSDSAAVYDADGRLEHQPDFGDALEHVLTTQDGETWVGYFDEAMGSSGPGSAGLVRYGPDQQATWVYPGRELPPIFDCYALNVGADSVACSAYNTFHLVTISGDRGQDHGAMPHRWGKTLLLQDDTGVIIGGERAEYDLITPFRLTPDGPVLDGQPRRLVMPDGMELPYLRWQARGPELHTFLRRNWLRTDLQALL